MKAKKTILIIVALLLVSALSVAGTLAYLTDSKSVTNTFTVGDVAIKLEETDITDTTKKTTEGNQYEHVIPGATYVKDPTVTVLEGSEECYVRIKVTLKDAKTADAVFGTADLTTIFNGYKPETWIAKDAKQINQTETNFDRVYEFWYKAPVDAQDGEVELAALFTSVTIPGSIDNDNLAKLDGLTLNIVAEAIQTGTFTDAAAAWTAFDAK